MTESARQKNSPVASGATTERTPPREYRPEAGSVNLPLDQAREKYSRDLLQSIARGYGAELQPGTQPHFVDELGQIVDFVIINVRDGSDPFKVRVWWNGEALQHIREGGAIAAERSGDSVIDQLIARYIDHQSVARAYNIRRPLNEQGNAERLVDAFGKDVRFNHTTERWMLWTGSRWVPDKSKRIRFLVKTTHRGIYGEAEIVEADTPSGKAERKAIASWAMKSEKAVSVAATLALALADPVIAITEESLNRDNWTLNLENGTLELRTATLRPHCREDMISLLAPVSFDPAARAPKWEAFVAEILPDLEVRRYIQTWAGYCLTGDVSAHVFLVAHGSGLNGKSTFFLTLTGLLGDYAGEVSPDVLMMARWSDGGKAATPQVAAMAGKRLILASESSAKDKIDSSMVKQLAGEGKIVARFLHGNPFSYTPTAKVGLETNHKPGVPDTDLGVWRRVKLIPFTVTIPEDKKDETLRAQLEAERAGILNWCMAGLARYLVEGLRSPEAVMAATAEYKDAEDVLRAFIDEACEADPYASARSGALFSRYSEWCKADNERPMTNRAFKAAMIEKGYEATHDRLGWYFSGIKIRRETNLEEEQL